MRFPAQICRFMNASALLKSQGWRGDGHSLDKGGRGLSRPLLISRKDNQSGLGTKKNDFKDQWWASAFDKSLKGWGSGSSTPTTAAPPTTPAVNLGTHVNPKIRQHAGLYNRFQKAETLVGTFTPPSETENMAILGETLHTDGGDSDKKNSKKRKHAKEYEGDVEGAIETKEKKSKKQKHSDEDEVNVGSKEKKEKSKSKRKPVEGPGAVKASGGEGTDAIEAAIISDAIPNVTPTLPHQYTATDPHPDSIMAKRLKDEQVDLPGDNGDPDILRYTLIKCYEQGDAAGIKGALRQAYPAVKRADERTEVNGKKLTYKAAKIERESLKRNAKRDAQHWVEVRSNPHVYRPDGTRISAKARGVTKEEREVKRDILKNDKQRKIAEKVARKELKKEKQLKMRNIKKENRAERKRKNHEIQMQHVSAKIQRKKDEVQAAKKGLSYEAFVDERAKELGVSTEVYKAEGKKLLNAHNHARQQKINDTAAAGREGKTYEEYAAERAAEFGMSLEEYKKTPPKVSGEKKSAEETEAVARAVAVDLAEDGESDSDTSDSSSSPDTSSSSDCSSDSDVEANTAIPNASKLDPTSTAADFVSLAPSTDQPFTTDTIGDPSHPVNHPLTSNPTSNPTSSPSSKKASKAERRALLAEKRARRAERAAATGEVRVSKKERAKNRAAAKEERISRMANEILHQRRQEHAVKRDGSTAAEGDVWAAGGAMVEKKSYVPTEREAHKSAVREAKRIARGMKKGRIPEGEVMDGWERNDGRNDKPMKDKPMKDSRYTGSGARGKVGMGARGPKGKKGKLGDKPKRRGGNNR